MLLNTFCHIQGIGLKTESDLWQAGVLCWDNFSPKRPATLSAGRADYIMECLELSRNNLASQPDYFTKLLPASQHWRIFPHFRAKTAYLDIETTGLSDDCEITTIALYDGNDIFYYVQGDNLDEFPSDINRFAVLVSYNGKSFDVPVIERFFGIRLNQAHIDLRFVLNALGYKGGLKGCEKQLGVGRDDLEGVDGYLAVLLWNSYQKTGNPRALETLLSYNIMDAVNLEILMVEAYNRNVAQTPFATDLKLSLPCRPPVPFAPDQDLLRNLPGLSRGYLW